MPGRDVVVVGSSAGGIDPLMRLVADPPPDFPATIFGVHHFPTQSAGGLALVQDPEQGAT
jgi:two-component system, chemotaxis family, protein-glutamate methylesterase/glutaminase